MAALQRAEAALRSAEAEAKATDAQAKAARTRAGWHSVLAPYAGRVTDLWVSAGDLATPGKPLLGLYNPTALRVIAQVPESMAARVQTNQPALLLVGESSPSRLPLGGSFRPSIRLRTAWRFGRNYRPEAALSPASSSVFYSRCTGIPGKFESP